MTGKQVDWKEALIKAKDAGRLSLEAYLVDEKGDRTLVYVHCKRLSEEEIEKARRKVKRAHMTKNTKPEK